MKLNDDQDDLLDAIERRIAHPDLDAEELGRIALTVERFIESGLVTETHAAELLAPRQGDGTT